VNFARRLRLERLGRAPSHQRGIGSVSRARRRPPRHAVDVLTFGRSQAGKDLGQIATSLALHLFAQRRVAISRLPLHRIRERKKLVKRGKVPGGFRLQQEGS